MELMLLEQRIAVVINNRRLLFLLRTKSRYAAILYHIKPFTTADLWSSRAITSMQLKLQLLRQC